MIAAHNEAHRRFRRLAERITYPGLTIVVQHEKIRPPGAREDAHCGHYLRVFCEEGTDNATGRPMSWKGRKWRLSCRMTDMEFVNTAFLAVLTALEHEARELFRVDGVALMDSHRDLAGTLGFMANGGGGHGRPDQGEKRNG